MERALKHKYSVGETVYFTASNVARPAASGTYEVIRLLPTDGDDCQYRIKSSTEAFSGWPRKVSSTFPKESRIAGRSAFRPPSKGPVHRTILGMMSAEKGIHFRGM